MQLLERCAGGEGGRVRLLALGQRAQALGDGSVHRGDRLPVAALQGLIQLRMQLLQALGITCERH
ncbi:hypothetical protein D3C77_544000 [compost metagenome]